VCGGGRGACCAQGSGISTGDPYGIEIYLVQVIESLYNDLDEQFITSIISGLRKIK
jgi:hypothetical protein